MANDELVDEVVPSGLLVDRKVAVIVLQPSSLGLGREAITESANGHQASAGWGARGCSGQDFPCQARLSRLT